MPFEGIDAGSRKERLIALEKLLGEIQTHLQAGETKKALEVVENSLAAVSRERIKHPST